MSLTEIVNSFNGKKILVVGDLILDRYIWGGVNRISPEAPVVVVKVSKDSARLGGAANVASNLSALGADVRLCGVVGDDKSSDDLIALIENHKINSKNIIRAKKRQTIIKTRVIANSQQVVRVDREDEEELDSATSKEVIQNFIEASKDVDGIIISDYGKGVINKNLLNSLDSFYDGTKKVLIDPKNINFNSYNKASFITPNKKEAQEASGVKISNPDDAIAVGKTLLKKWNSDSVLITLGEMGMVFVSRDTSESFHLPTQAREVYDVSGAGDTVAASFLLSSVSGASSKDCANIANKAAGIVIKEVGTVVISKEKLLAEL